MTTMTPTVHGLRCEYRVDPQGLDALQPRLGWLIASGRRGERQTAFQVLVASTPELLAQDRGDRWDSGRVASDASIQVVYAGAALASRERCNWKVRIWDRDGRPSPWSQPASWSMGLLQRSDWQARWIGLEETDASPPAPRQLRKSFVIDRPIRRATIHATALGLYELRLNGARVGDQLLAPEWTDYRKRVQYQTQDVTALLHPGGNCLGAMLGNGWYCGHWQFWKDRLRPIYGTQPFLLAQLEIELVDGSTVVVASDGSWRGTTAGPLRLSGIYEGETYDARRELPGWDEADFDDRAWRPVQVAEPAAGRLVWQRSEPIRVSQELVPVEVTEPKPGVFVVDLGQNIAGWCRLRVRAAAGTEVMLKHNEVLNPDGTVYMDNLHAGNLSTGDRQIVRYICRGGGEEVYEPHFTYCGFRYVEVTGLAEPPTITGVVFHTAMAPSGCFTCSNPLLNRLVLNTQWSQRGNIMGVPTDCCQRDERCGYTGDMNFFMPTAVFNFDIAAFCSKWLVDVCEDSQLPQGNFADHAPTYEPGDNWNVGWSDAGIICPWLAWRTYGDTYLIREHYAAMRRCIEGQIDTAHDHRRGPDKIGHGDWLNLGGGADKEVVGTAYYAYCLQLMAAMAEAIGEADDAACYGSLAVQVRDAFLAHLVATDGRIRDSSQTGYALAFTMGLVPEARRAAMAQRFVDEIERFGGHLATGFIGTPRLLPGLHAAGRDDVAYRVLLQEDYPSWLFQVRHGATTMWERWNGWRPETGFAWSGMNSFNHYAFGSVGEYLYGVVGGIAAAAPGFKVTRIAPAIQPGLDWAEATYVSIHGRIRSAWRRDPSGFSLEVTIPANTSGVIVLPVSSSDAVSEGGRPVAEADGVAVVRAEGDGVAIEVGSGSYVFRWS